MSDAERRTSVCISGPDSWDSQRKGCTMKCQSVLVVEDNDDIRETVEEVLRMEGYPVYAVSDGRQALRALKTIPGPPLILLDMMMPLMNGWEFLEAQKADAKFANLPVVVISALDATRALARGAGGPIEAQGYIRKPLDIDTLMGLVRIYCGEPAASPVDIGSREASASSAGDDDAVAAS
jgi:CheY-like chemotaxis protein